jgi:hypothetical protein
MICGRRFQICLESLHGTRNRNRANRCRAAIADLFGTLAFTAHMLGEGRLYAFAAKRCLAD